MKIKERNRCARCMQELNEAIFCTNCGYDQRQDNPERALPAGTLLNDKYLIGAVIGEGGFGIIYAAWDMLIETRIAIKEYFPSELVTRDTTLSGEKAAHNLTLIQEKTGEGRYREGLERFVKEAGNLAKFQKEPGVVSVKDFFYENNTAYMVMEYIEGVTLNTYLENHNGKLGTQEVFRMIEPVMKTLEAIHKEGVIHRDISPDNIMVTEDGQMKLIDFGAARFVGADDEKSLTVILKHGYAPEEQYRSNGEQGPWTDVYALSAVIYRMLTGKAPEENLKRMTGGQDNVSSELKRVQGLSGAERKGLERGLAVKAEKRLRSMEELHKEIYSKTEVPLWKWLAGAVVLFAVVLGVCFVGLLDRRDEKLAVLEEVQEQDTLERKTPVPEKEEEPEKETGENREEEEAEEEEQPQEPEYIRQLREYYNSNYVGKTGKVFFVDLTGDGKDEMIVAEGWKIEDTSEFYDNRYPTSLTVFQCKCDKVETIHESESREVFLVINDEEICFLILNYADSVSYLKKVFWDNDNEKATDEIIITEENFMEKIQQSVLLVDYNWTIHSWDINKEMNSYEEVLACKEEVQDAVKIAKEAEGFVMDYATVYDNDIPCTLTVVDNWQKIKDSYNNMGEEVEYSHNEEIFSVWAKHDQQIEKLEDLEECQIDMGFMCQVYQFGKSRHYVVWGINNIGTYNYKYCFENGKAFKKDDEHCFIKNEDGTIQMEVQSRIPIYGKDSYDEISTETDYTDIFYFNQQYVEYGAELVDKDILEQYENWDEVLSMVEDELRKKETIISLEAMIYRNCNVQDLDCSVTDVELDYARKAANNTVYLNYKVSFVVDYMEWNPWNPNLEYKLNDLINEGDKYGTWAHAVLKINGNRLEYKEIVFGEREEYSDIGLPVYYGPDRELMNGN